MQYPFPGQRTNGDGHGRSSGPSCLVWADLTRRLPASALFAELAGVCRAMQELHGRITTLLERSRAGEERAHAAIRLPAQPTPDRRERRTAPAIAFIAANFHERVDLATAARVCHLSPSHFSRVFKREHGVTFSHYLVQYRIRRACDLLAAPGRSVKEVGFGVGFNDLAYFSRTFRRCVGVCPTQYQSGAPGH